MDIQFVNHALLVISAKNYTKELVRLKSKSSNEKIDSNLFLFVIKSKGKKYISILHQSNNQLDFFKERVDIYITNVNIRVV